MGVKGHGIPADYRRRWWPLHSLRPWDAQRRLALVRDWYFCGSVNMRLGIAPHKTILPGFSSVVLVREGQSKKFERFSFGGNPGMLYMEVTDYRGRR